jgi:hypothetical protein
MNSKQKGELSEQIVLTELMRLGLPVSKPIGDNQRYDLIVDCNGKLLKGQVKTGYLSRTNKVTHRTYSTRINSKHYITKGYKGEIDLFFVYCPTNNEVWVTPISYAAKNSCQAKYVLKDWFMSAQMETSEVEAVKLGETSMGGNPEPSLRNKEGVETKRQHPKVLKRTMGKR